MHMPLPQVLKQFNFRSLMLQARQKVIEGADIGMDTFHENTDVRIAMSKKTVRM